MTKQETKINKELKKHIAKIEDYKLEGITIEKMEQINEETFKHWTKFGVLRVDIQDNEIVLVDYTYHPESAYYWDKGVK